MLTLHDFASSFLVALRRGCTLSQFRLTHRQTGRRTTNPTSADTIPKFVIVGRGPWTATQQRQVRSKLAAGLPVPHRKPALPVAHLVLSLYAAYPSFLGAISRSISAFLVRSKLPRHRAKERMGSSLNTSGVQSHAIVSIIIASSIVIIK